MNTALARGIITAASAILVALITTLGTIYSTRSGIAESQHKLQELSTEANKLSIPVGTIVASVLNPVEFAKSVGDPINFDLTKSKWTLADDKGKIPGTTYAELTVRSNLELNRRLR